MNPSVYIPAVMLDGETEQARRGTWRETWMTSPQDRAAIVALLQSINAEDVIEIGVNEGYTAACILENVKSIKRYRGVDVLPGYRTPLPQQCGEVTEYPAHMVRDDRFELLLRKRGSYDLMPSDLGICDAMFIDGDHSCAGVLNDTALAQDCVRGGGLIIWHDYCEDWYNEVRIILEQMFVGGILINHVANTWIAFMWNKQ